MIKPVDKYWCYGNSCGKMGLFPSDHLIPTETPDRANDEELFLAIADFPGQQDGDLSFRKGMRHFVLVLFSFFRSYLIDILNHRRVCYWREKIR